MSVHENGKGWKVRWRETDATGAVRNRSKNFDRKGDAERHDTKVRRVKQLGPQLAREVFPEPHASVTLDGFVGDGFKAHASTLAPKTREQYGWAMRNHLVELQDTPLDEITVPLLMAHQTRLLDRGRSPHTVRTAMTMLSGILQVAVEHGVIPANPVKGMRKVKVEKTDEIRPLTPVETLALMDAFDGRFRIVIVLGAMLGLRPLEIRLVRWDDLGDGTLTIGRARTKSTAARTRVITVPKIAMAELRAWRMASGRPAGDTPIIGEMSVFNFKAWGTRKLGPVGDKAIGRDVTVYTLRHTHASALHYCGWTVPAAARRLGHGPALHVTHYAHVIDALEGQPHYADLDALYAGARATLDAKPNGRVEASS